MEHDWKALGIAPDDALKALAQMRSTGLSRLLVVEGERLVGIVSLKDLLRFIHLKLELEGEEGNDDRPRRPLRDSRREPKNPSPHP